jgi:predicted TIM-barrel fold metal-dependent hydrolase
VSFPENPSYLKLPSLHTDHWDPVFRAFEETGAVCSMHLGSSGHIPIPTPDSHFSVAITAAPAVVGIETITDMLFGTLPRRFPNVHFVLTEGGIGYIPYVLERADFVWGKHRFWAPFGDIKPSELFHRQFAVCAVNEAFGLSADAIDLIGIDNILWESDYPHSETPWPASQTEAAKVLGHLTQPQIDKITHQNAERIFNFPVTPASKSANTVHRLDNSRGNGERPEPIKAYPIVVSDDDPANPDITSIIAGASR